MLLSEVTKEHIGKTVVIEKQHGSFAGTVAWVDDTISIGTNDKYYNENSRVGWYEEYNGQDDYHYWRISKKVGFVGEKSLEISWKEPAVTVPDETYGYIIKDRGEK